MLAEMYWRKYIRETFYPNLVTLTFVSMIEKNGHVLIV